MNRSSKKIKIKLIEMYNPEIEDFWATMNLKTQKKIYRIVHWDKRVKLKDITQKELNSWWQKLPMWCVESIYIFIKTKTGIFSEFEVEYKMKISELKNFIEESGLWNSKNTIVLLKFTRYPKPFEISFFKRDEIILYRDLKGKEKKLFNGLSGEKKTKLMKEDIDKIIINQSPKYRIKKIEKGHHEILPEPGADGFNVFFRRSNWEKLIRNEYNK